MNNLRTSVSVLLCCVLLISTPLGFVGTASATSDAPDNPVDFCEPDTIDITFNEMNAAAEEAMEHLPRWYQDVARDNTIHIHIYDNRYPDDPYPMLFFTTHVGADFQVYSTGEFPGDWVQLDLASSLTVETDCQTLTRIMYSDDKTDAVVDAIWEDDIRYYGHGPGADAAVVYSESLLTGAYVMEHRQPGGLGDFINGALAPVTKTYEELRNNYERLFTPFEDEPARPGGR